MRSEAKLSNAELKYLQFDRMPEHCRKVLLPHFEKRLGIIANGYPLAPKRAWIKLAQGLTLNNFHGPLMPAFKPKVIEVYKRAAAEHRPAEQKAKYAQLAQEAQEVQNTLLENAIRANINPGRWVAQYREVQSSGTSGILGKEAGTIVAHKAKLWPLMVMALKHVKPGEESEVRENLTRLLGLNLNEEITK